jgi:phage protein U
MFAQLGTIVFENLKSFTDYSRTGAVVYAEHALLDGKPLLQRTGPALDELYLTIRFHASFTNPTEQLENLIDARDSGEILPLIFGDGTIQQGTFVITEINETIEDADPQGNVFSYLINLSLKEYITPDKLQQQQQHDRDNASAVGDKKAVVKKKANPLTCPQYVSSLVSKIEAHASANNVLILEKGGGATEKGKAQIKSHYQAIKKLSDELITQTNKTESCTQPYPFIKTYATSLSQECPVYILDLNNSPERIPADNRSIQTHVKALKSAARPLTNQSITRK